MHNSEEYWRALIRMGLTKMFMLRALLDQPLHGYDLARRASELSGGICTPSEGTIYPVLRDWEREGIVEGHWESVGARRRRVYELTDAGREALAAAQSVWSEAARTVLDLPVPDTDRLADHLL